MLSAACAVQYTQYDAGSGKRGYYISCADSAKQCESQANNLCPDGFQRVHPTERSKSGSALLVQADSAYALQIECAGSGRAQPGAPSGP